MTTLQRYKPLPSLDELNPGYQAGWLYDVLILQAEPDDKIGSLYVAESTKLDEAGASIVALVVDISPTAFKNADWDAVVPGLSDHMPYRRGDVVLTKRYPSSAYIVGADQRRYLMVKDTDIIGKQITEAWAQTKAEAA